MLVRSAGSVVLLAALVGSCSSAGGSTPAVPTVTQAETPAPTVQPQVLRDVVSAAFEVPGAEMRGAIHLLQFTRNLGIQECGGRPGPADGTYNREDQSLFPDLELIREKGFTEPAAVRAEDKRLEAMDASCQEIAPDLPHYVAWRQAIDSWTARVVAAEKSATVRDQKPALAHCLTMKSGATVPVGNPAYEFLKMVNTENAEGASKARLADLADFYADCAGGYFAALRGELIKSRPLFVDRNHELLDDFAAELVAAGYVP